MARPQKLQVSYTTLVRIGVLYEVNWRTLRKALVDGPDAIRGEAARRRVSAAVAAVALELAAQSDEARP